MEPIKKPNLTNEVIERVLSIISIGDVKPGEQLPTEREIAEKLNVGRSTVREALKSLKVLGILEVKQGGGTFVKSDGISLLNNSIEWGILLNEEWITDLIDVRHLVEPHLAWLASQKRTEEDLGLLASTLNNMKKIKRFDKFAEEDIKFHILLAKASHNRIFSSVVETIQALLRIWITDSINRTEDLSVKVDEHQKIYEAVVKREADLAQAAMLYHLEKGNERFRTKMRQG